MIKNIFKKIILIIILIVIYLNTFQGVVSAIVINNPIKSLHDCGEHLQFFDEKQNNWSNVITTYTQYIASNGNKYPAYCLTSTMPKQPSDLKDYGNVSNLLADSKVWRVITNGYPYSNLGLNNDDAFVATKQALYSIIENRDIKNYRGLDNRGNAIVDQIKYLVNIGRNGKAIPNGNNIFANKVGKFSKFNDKYYAQNYSVSANIEISGYEVSKLEGFPKNSYVGDTYGNAKTSFLAGENFKIFVPKEEIKNNFTGTIKFESKCENVSICYGFHPDVELQDRPICYEAYEEVEGLETLNVDNSKSNINVHKIDEETKSPIEGVVFNAKYKDTHENIGNFKTNRDGEFIINNLRAGTIILTEIETVKDYILDTKEYEIEVEFGETKDINITNQHKKGDLKVVKVDKDNNQIKLENVEFDLYSKELQKVIGSYKTNENGEIYVKNLRTGNYQWIEKNTNIWYNLNKENTEAIVEWNKTNESIIQNELKKGKIKVIKVDKDNDKILLEGVIFDILDEKGQVVDTIKTNEKGEALTKALPINQRYTVIEKETNEEYALSKETKTVALEDNKIKEITFENEKIKGYIEITKVSEDDNKYNGIPAKTPLEGATFEIYDNQNNIVDTITTNSEGKAITKLLLKGAYTVKEKSTGSIYYLLNEDEYKVEIKNEKEIVPLRIENKSVQLDVSVEKRGYQETKKNDIIKYDFSNIANNSNVCLNSFKWLDYLPTNYIRLNKIETGTWNQEVIYSITYETNFNDNERILAQNLNSKENYQIDCTNIGLQEGEYITRYSFNFGKVDIGFKEETSPDIFCKVLDTVNNKETFTNKTETIGEYQNLIATGEDEWTTFIYEKEIHDKKLPKTGMFF